MARIYIKLDKLSSFILNMNKERVKRVVGAVQATAMVKGPLLFQQAVDATQPYKPVDIGTYRREFRVDRADFGAVLYNPTAYASVIEHGRRPGQRMPPPDALVGWVKRKGLLRDLPAGANRDAAARGLAYVIARKLAAQGTPAKNVMRRAVTKLLPEVIAAVRKAMVTP